MLPMAACTGCARLVWGRLFAADRICQRVSANKTSTKWRGCLLVGLKPADLEFLAQRGDSVGLQLDLTDLPTNIFRP